MAALPVFVIDLPKSLFLARADSAPSRNQMSCAEHIGEQRLTEMESDYIAGPGYLKVSNQRSVNCEMYLECNANSGLYGTGVWIRVGPAAAAGKSSPEEIHENVLKLTPKQARLFVEKLNAEIKKAEALS